MKRSVNFSMEIKLRTQRNNEFILNEIFSSRLLLLRAAHYPPNKWANVDLCSTARERVSWNPSALSCYTTASTASKLIRLNHLSTTSDTVLQEHRCLLWQWSHPDANETSGACNSSSRFSCPTSDETPATHHSDPSSACKNQQSGSEFPIQSSARSTVCNHETSPKCFTFDQTPGCSSKSTHPSSH